MTASPPGRPACARDQPLTARASRAATGPVVASGERNPSTAGAPTLPSCPPPVNHTQWFAPLVPETIPLAQVPSPGSRPAITLPMRPSA